MTKLFNICASFFMIAFCTTAINAQADKGTLVLEITEMSSDNPQMASMADMFKGNETFVYFSDGASLTKMNMMGGMVKIDMKMDKESNSDLLFDAMGNKIWVASTKIEQDRAKAEADNPMEEMDITYDMDDKKTIAGFECYKMTVDFIDAEGVTMEAYVTEAIGIRPPVIQGVDMKDFKGFPLEYTMNNPQMQLTIVAKSFEPTVDESVFELNTSGYQKMTMKEFTDMMSSMGGGGFGF